VRDKQLPAGDAGVTAMAAYARVTQPTASHHLRDLRAAGLVHVERVGQSVCCALDRARLLEIAGYLSQLAGTPDSEPVPSRGAR